MGIIGAFVYFLLLVGCGYFIYVLQKKKMEQANPLALIVGQFALSLFLFLNVIFIVDTFIIEIPNPFQKEKVETLKKAPAEVPEPKKLEFENVEPIKANVKKAKEEHKKLLEDFEGKDAEQ